jgi:G patch domain-containing protein 1
MDEEDLREAEEARQLETDRNFAGIGGPEDGARSLMDLLMPAIQDTMGTKLLKKMGWKEGQGIGPKTMRKARDFDGETAVETNKSFLFAPENSKLVSFRRKDNAQGLGYIGEGSLGNSQKPDEGKDEDAGFGTAALKPTKPKKRSGPAFGVGILNEDGEDEEDPYEIRPKSSYNRVIGGDKPKKTKPAPRPLAAGKHVFVPKKAATLKSYQTARKCHDGRLPLPGFILSDVAIEPQAPRYPPPKVPEDWKGTPEETPPPKAVSTTDSSVPKLDPRARGALLGEAPLPGKSVFDFLTPDARNRIANLTGKTDLPQGLGEAPPSTTRSTIADIVPHLDSSVALSALKGGYMPYGDDPDKRARYRSFLEVKAGLREGLPDRVPPSLSPKLPATATNTHRNTA